MMSLGGNFRLHLRYKRSGSRSRIERKQKQRSVASRSNRICLIISLAIFNRLRKTAQNRRSSFWSWRRTHPHLQFHLDGYPIHAVNSSRLESVNRVQSIRFLYGSSSKLPVSLWWWMVFLSLMPFGCITRGLSENTLEESETKKSLIQKCSTKYADWRIRPLIAQNKQTNIHDKVASIYTYNL